MSEFVKVVAKLLAHRRAFFGQQMPAEVEGFYGHADETAVAHATLKDEKDAFLFYEPHSRI